MNLALRFREAFTRRQQAELDAMQADLSNAWDVEHNEDGTHGALTASSAVVSGAASAGSLALSGSFSASLGPWRLSGGAIITPAALTAGAGADWNPSGLATAVLIRVSASGAPRNLSGIVAQPDGTLLYVLNVGGVNNVVLVHDLTSAAANRFYCPGAANYTLTPYMGAVIVYDGTLTRWLVIG